MREATFAGARVSAEGIRPDLRKVRAILEWPEPISALDIMGFLGAVGAHRTKIRNFARIAQPLSDLTRNVRTPPAVTGSGFEYKKALREATFELDETQKKAFVDLKVALTTHPVLRAPIYDGRSFIVLTDGSKYGFGAVLSQRWEETDSKGNVRQVMYPVAFASKRTSRTEERYILFLLEFAALKFAMDEFDPIIFGREIKIETDCKALAELLGNSKPNSTHERWRELIIARNISAVRHLPGTKNRLCDGLSRMYEGRPDNDEGPGQTTDVDPGWEARKELLNDMYLLLDNNDTANLLKRFKDNTYFTDILEHLLFDEDVESDDKEAQRERRRRAHRAEGYFVEDGKLWLSGGKHSRAGSKVECIPESEGRRLALSVHEAGGHFGRDLTVLTLQQEYHWPKLRAHATEAVTLCSRCKNFGPRLLSALLRPITRARPFDLLVGDYVSLPEGHGGFKTVLVLTDVYSRYMFTFPSKKPGTGKFTTDALDRISDLILTPRVFMADGGGHFNCDEVRRWAEARGSKVIITPPYSPWANGLAEGSVKLLINRLKKLCAPSVGEDPDDVDDANSTPTAWLKHLTTAVSQLNDRLSGERRAELGRAVITRAVQDADTNLALTYSLRQDAYAKALEHAAKRKKAFDKKARVVDYRLGDLVQKYDARLDETHSSMRKLAPRWSGPLQIVDKSANSYKLEDLEGNTFTQAAHARLIRPFIPRSGSTLDRYVRSLESARAADRSATTPNQYFGPQSLPRLPRPERRVPLERDDATQPNKYQADEADDSLS
ncbi:Retrovirus-related Pol polyprotein from transposon [Ceratobasidium sp. AG-Ba]|nr:Retrovirus-related Pol polyprotein from transposon [Ceratobasidium sp. AG-Ba]